jgi:hypothetical protein
LLITLWKITSRLALDCRFVYGFAPIQAGKEGEERDALDPIHLSSLAPLT